MLLLIWTLATGCGPTTDDTAEAAYSSEVYADGANWLCHPDVDDCSSDLDVTVVEADGTSSVVEHMPAVDPAVDCFYVYPTLSLDEGIRSDLERGAEEPFVVAAQAAPFTSQCRLFAPMYRQVTVTGLFAASLDDWDGAYADVLDAFEHYLANDNDGRPFVLLGHSQGSAHLTRLLSERIEGDALHEQMVAAYLIGISVEVPEGDVVGGSFTETPLCTELGQTGCVVSYASFRTDTPPDSGALFGVTPNPTTVAACVNPASPGGRSTLDGRFPAEVPDVLAGFFGDDPSPYADGTPIDTPFFSVPGLVEGECKLDQGRSWLDIDILADSEDPRVDDLEGDLLPGWGLHLVDYNLAMGDLLAFAEAQIDAYEASR